MNDVKKASETKGFTFGAHRPFGRPPGLSSNRLKRAPRLMFRRFPLVGNGQIPALLAAKCTRAFYITRKNDLSEDIDERPTLTKLYADRAGCLLSADQQPLDQTRLVI